MRAGSILVIILLSCSYNYASAQMSFEEHDALAKAGKLGEREVAFANLCGVNLAASAVTYGYSVDESFNLKSIATMPGTELAQTDNFGTAELWSVDGKPRLLNVWNMIMDTGNYQNGIFCMDANGKLTAMETLNTNEPPGAPANYWRHLEVDTFAADERRTVVSSKFVDKTGKPIVAPKLDKAGMFNATDTMMLENVPLMIKQISGGTQ